MSSLPCFLSPKGESVEINGQQLVFYPLSVKSLHKLKDFIPQLARAVSSLFADTTKDFGSNAILDGEGGSQQTVDPVSVEMATFRDTQKSGALEELLALVLDPKHQGMLGDMIIDSLRDKFPRGSEDNIPGKELINGTDTVTLVALMKALLLANAQVFGPMEGKVRELLKANETKEETNLTETPG